MFLEEMDAKLVNAGALAGSRHSTDAHSDAAPRMGQTFLDDLLSHLLMLRNSALHECHGLTQYGDVATQDALDIVGSRKVLAGKTTALQIWIDVRNRCHSTVHCQSCILGTILWMLHDDKELCPP